MKYPLMNMAGKSHDVGQKLGGLGKGPPLHSNNVTWVCLSNQDSEHRETFRSEKLADCRIAVFFPDIPRLIVYSVSSQSLGPYFQRVNFSRCRCDWIDDSLGSYERNVPKAQNVAKIDKPYETGRLLVSLLRMWDIGKAVGKSWQAYVIAYLRYTWMFCVFLASAVQLPHFLHTLPTTTCYSCRRGSISASPDQWVARRHTEPSDARQDRRHRY